MPAEGAYANRHSSPASAGVQFTPFFSASTPEIRFWLRTIPERPILLGGRTSCESFGRAFPLSATPTPRVVIDALQHGTVQLGEGARSGQPLAV